MVVLGFMGSFITGSPMPLVFLENLGCICPTLSTDRNGRIPERVTCDIKIFEMAFALTGQLFQKLIHLPM